MLPIQSGENKSDLHQKCNEKSAKCISYEPLSRSLDEKVLYVLLSFPDAIQAGVQDNNLPVPPARSAMANLYPTSQQPGLQTNPVVNVIYILTI